MRAALVILAIAVVAVNAVVIRPGAPLSDVGKPVNECYDVKDQRTCENSEDPVSSCIWCFAAAVPSVCVNKDQAGRLPEGVFNCVNKTAIAAPVPPVQTLRDTIPSCYDVKNEGKCRRSTDSNGKCQWCVSRAVPSVCVDPSQASRLPSGVFNCN